MYYHMLSESNKHYVVDEQMNISQAHWALHEDYGLHSGKWKLNGFRKVLSFNHLGTLVSIRDLIDSKLPLRFKNGRGRFIVEDIDHGTKRYWSDRIVSIWTTESI